MQQSQLRLQRTIMTLATLALVFWWRANFFPWGLLVLATLAVLWILNR